MFGIGKQKASRASYGVTMDVGSGSVAVAIVESREYEKQGRVIWTLREWVPVHKNIDRQRLNSNLKTAAANCFLALESEGQKTLQQVARGAKLKKILVSISAPAAFTVSKTVSLEKDKEFVVNAKLVRKLEEEALSKASEEVDPKQLEAEMALKPITHSITSIKLNGYSVADYEGKKVNKLELTLISCLAHSEIVSTILDGKDKILPGTQLYLQSFITTYFQAINSLTAPRRTALVDITAEATELGIVEDSNVTYSSYIPTGTNFIARGVNDLLNTPFSESLGFMKDNQVNLTKDITPEKQEQLEVIRSTYESKLTELLTGSDGKLDLPNSIFLHCDAGYEKFFKERLERILSTKEDHPEIFAVTSKFFPGSPVKDNATLLAAYVFHKKLYCDEEFAN